MNIYRAVNDFGKTPAKLARLNGHSWLASWYMPKEPCISAKELCVYAKEHWDSMKELCISAKET